MRSEMSDPLVDGGEEPPTASATSTSASKSSSRRRVAIRKSLDADKFINLLHGSDHVKVELSQLENEVRDKDRELGEAQAEIKALRLSERARKKACKEFTKELERLDEKLKLTESLLENRNLEIKKINDEKKAAMAAQFAAEATLRRVHAAQKDDDMPPIEAILAPLEAELKLARQEIVDPASLSYLRSSLSSDESSTLVVAEGSQVALRSSLSSIKKCIKNETNLFANERRKRRSMRGKGVVVAREPWKS